ncbi:class I SAM-dependent methyltransferase [Roseomonas sp. CCTCC AB2023176]|uniref:class I SAM-dependent methyltransferase n=1 Tax=Roseomonas sp. CCTCC AB2023176 TaxID=3342640 RepID=UPI0035DE7009
MSDGRRGRGGWLAGKGFRERLLRQVGAGSLYDEMARLRAALVEQRREIERQAAAAAEASRDAELAARNSALAVRQAQEDARRATADAADRVAAAEEHVAHADERLAAAKATSARYRAERDAEAAGLRHYLDLRDAGKLIEMDYAVRPRSRHGWGRPPHAQLLAGLRRGNERYKTVLESFLPLVDQAAEIAAGPGESGQPHWLNDWFPAFDAISLYGFIATRRPRRFVEIGSGNSTLFARRAISDFALPTRIVSLDPNPRADIDAICDEVVREPLEEVAPAFWDEVTAEDIVFFDGSHRAFQNSDVTVFFTEVLPALAVGTLVGIHDIFLPLDYPPVWVERYYNEQYLLACWLLAGERLRVELPVKHCTETPDLHGVLTPLWSKPALAGAAHIGGCFWFTITERS